MKTNTLHVKWITLVVHFYTMFQAKEIAIKIDAGDIIIFIWFFG